MAEPTWSQRGPVDRFGRPLMPKPHWVGGVEEPTSPPVVPPAVPTEPTPPALVPLMTRESRFRDPRDCGLATYQAEHIRIGSPISGSEAAGCYQEAAEWSAQMLAFGVKETELGKTAKGSHNFLNLFGASNAPIDFASWAECAKEWRRRFQDPRYKGGVYPMDATVEQVIATYQGGPECWRTKGDSCANGETWEPCKAGSIELSIQQLCARVNTYLGRVQKVPWSPVPGGAGCQKPELPPGQPAIYTLERDYARFGLTKQQALQLQSRCFVSRSGQSPLGMFVHVQEGTTPGSLS
jgi:hypothetical protein